MRDYSFGNFLQELRMRRGLTQYQLGALVGVSDKAVSKWENGSAKPQSRILYTLGEVLGISVDELLSCKYRSFTEKDKKGIFAMKKKLWNKASEAMRTRYGENVPVEILNRYFSEYAEMQGTDMIVYLDMLATLADAAKTCGEHIRVKGDAGASFIAFLLGATEIDPLKPHYYCPACRKVEFVDSAADGWDLPAKKCDCGKEMLSDGHNIPFETHRHVVHINTYFELSMSPGFFEEAKELVRSYFRDCKLVGLTRNDMPHIFTFVLVPERMEIPVGAVLSFEAYYDKLEQYPSFTFCADAGFARYKELEMQTGTRFARVRFWQCDVLQTILDGDTDGIPEFKTDFFKDMLHAVQPTSFHDIIQLTGLSHGTGVWTNNAQDLISTGMPVGKTIAYRDDVFRYMQEKMLHKGIANTGYAYKVMEDTRRGVYARGGISDAMRQQLQSIGAEDWFIGSIGKIGYLFPKSHGVLYVKLAATLMWYKIHYPDAFASVMGNR